MIQLKNIKLVRLQFHVRCSSAVWLKLIPRHIQIILVLEFQKMKDFKEILYIPTMAIRLNNFSKCSMEIRMMDGITINHFWSLTFWQIKCHEMRVIMGYNMSFCIWDYQRFNHTAAAHFRNQTNKVLMSLSFIMKVPFPHISDSILRIFNFSFSFQWFAVTKNDAEEKSQQPKKKNLNNWRQTGILWNDLIIISLKYSYVRCLNYIPFITVGIYHIYQMLVAWTSRLTYCFNAESPNVTKWKKSD